MSLNKFTPNLEIARSLSGSVFRFYELKKYLMLEDEVGRSDPCEGAISFPQEEYNEFPEKLPIASFKGIEFSFFKSQVDVGDLRQFFVFCMSKGKCGEVIGDSKYVVELSLDVFEFLEAQMNELFSEEVAPHFPGVFVVDEIEYYNIHSHPQYSGDNPWKEIYRKHSKYQHQEEVRASFLVTDSLFDELMSEGITVDVSYSLNLDIKGKRKTGYQISSGIDSEGWRYVEFDLSELAESLGVEPFSVREL